MAAFLVIGFLVFAFAVVLILPEPRLLNEKQRQEFREVEAMRERLLRGELGDF